uniref:SNF2 N-terminal domain-containing protein n=1 Tax=Ditylenchus dipsaci TaxID=166011 RepID=A0A915D5P0_9BILA
MQDNMGKGSYRSSEGKRLRVHIFHGPKNKREISAKRLSQYDMVITTYQTVSSELSEKFKIDEDFAALDSSTNSPFQKKVRNGGDIPAKKYVVSITSGSVLTKVIWERIILDEAHQIKNRLSLVSKSCCKLNAGARWCLTGIIFVLRYTTNYGFVFTHSISKVTPFGEEKVWKESIMSASKSNADRLNCLVKGLLLRRTKNQICEVTNKPIVDLKPRLYELIELTLQEPEDRCYQVMFDASRQKVRDLLKNQEDVANYGFLDQNKKNKQVERVKNPF